MLMISKAKNSTAALALVAGLVGTSINAQEFSPTYSLYGTPGLIEMPTAQSAADGDIAVTVGYWGDHLRNTMSFQISPRLSGSFRYSRIDNFQSLTSGETFDRSFDLRYRFVDEGRYVPAIAVGLQDFLGTGLYSAEYLVASKTFGSSVQVTGGLGWGRFGTEGGFTNPLGAIDSGFETRPAIVVGTGGRPATDQWFRGDAAFFAGVEWQATDQFTFKAEYSSDAYAGETANGTFEPDSPFNFGAVYQPRPGIQLGLNYLYGEEVGLTGTFILNPKDRPSVGGNDPAPLPVLVRGDVDAAASWDAAQGNIGGTRALVAQALAADGIELVSMELSRTRVRVRIVNGRYGAMSQAVGHVARVLTHTMPASVETFVIEPVEEGIALSAITLQRTDIEQLELAPNGTALSLERAEFDVAGGDAGLVIVENDRPRFNWGVAPYFRFSSFDPDSPIRADLGVEVSASYEFQPNLILSGAVRKRIVGNLDESFVRTPSLIEPVRSNGAIYNQQGDPTLEYLTLAYYFVPTRDVYGRVTVGYLERMFGGVSAEVLWKPVDSRLAIGAELNYVGQRDFDVGFGFQDYTVAMGHVSAYYDFGNGYHGQVDVGRYLAGDYGATFALDREFDNGWSVGAFFTLTDVSADDFGEGSFDKGLRVSIPIDWFFGTPTRTVSDNTIRSLSRDGGAKLDVEGRLYGIVRDAHRPELEQRWGRFWR